MKFESMKELEDYARASLYYKEACFYFIIKDLTVSFIKEKFKDYSNVVLDFEDEADEDCFSYYKKFFSRRMIYAEETGENQYTLHFKTTQLPDDVIEEYFNSL